MSKYWQMFLESSHRIMLLQGPVGPFFRLLKHHLETTSGKTIYKINFNGGDCYDYPLELGVELYNSPISQFADFLKSQLLEKKIDSVVCFGDERIYHQIAKDVCDELGIDFWVFEEGYLRPHYITFEKWGVNANSRVEVALQNPASESNAILPANEIPCASGFWKRAKMAACYYIAMWRHRRHYPHYKHHRSDNGWHYIGAWLLAAYRKVRYHFSDRKIKREIISGRWDPFFIFPLQVHNDSQIRVHGKDRTVADRIREVIRSFAQNAPQSTALFIKHHPMDRGFSHYGRLIKKLTRHYGIENRVIYCFEVPMPIFLRQARGVIVVNSTTGISALIHKLPVKVLGDAHYDREGLTSSQTLAEFWKNPYQPDEWIIRQYLEVIAKMTQINSNYYHEQLTAAFSDR